MIGTDFTNLVGPALAGALERKGFSALTPVQEAVLDPALAGRDLRITSQTGSGKTVAIGFALRELAQQDSASAGGMGRPRIMVVAPTRELAKQVEEELAWLYAPLDARVVSVTGGASYRDERRALLAGPAVVVGTPGRLLDHLQRGGIDATQVGAVVLDEADRMLDLGFREDLLAILKFAPEAHLTHLISATFPREVRALADKVQNQPAHVEGTPLGTANADIDHLIHLVDPRHRVDAIVNLLLATPEAQTLVFARTRADVAEITRQLGEAGFDVSSLSGEMEQRERNRALAKFKSGDLHALIATDVAARGIDVQDIGRVIHAEPPTDADAYTHRSGRTGRAGKKGTSSVLVSPSTLSKTQFLLQRAGVRGKIAPIPTAAEIRAASDDRVFAELTREVPEEALDARTMSLAQRLIEAGNGPRLLARLLSRARHGGPTEPRDVRPIAAPAERRPRTHVSTDEPRGAQRDRRGGWVLFRVSWGREQGADPRRILALVCRRGGVRSSDVGAIDIARNYATVEVSSTAAQDFARAAVEPDARDPRITIRQEGDHTPREHAPPAAREQAPTRPEQSPREHTPRDHAPREHPPRDRPTREHAPREDAPREQPPREQPPREQPPREPSTREHAPRPHAHVKREYVPRENAHAKREFIPREPARPHARPGVSPSPRPTRPDHSPAKHRPHAEPRPGPRGGDAPLKRKR